MIVSGKSDRTTHDSWQQAFESIPPSVRQILASLPDPAEITRIVINRNALGREEHPYDLLIEFETNVGTAEKGEE